MHHSASMQSYISKEVNRPCKQWIYEVLSCRRETERVKLRTPEFVLLPDVDCISKRLKQYPRIGRIYPWYEAFDYRQAGAGYPDSGITALGTLNPSEPQPWQTDEVAQTLSQRNQDSSHSTPDRRQWRSKRIAPPTACFHWLAVATNTDLRTLRDLRGCHIPMLQALYTRTCQKIHEETGVDPGQIMAYIHYPPSVYQLHVHFKHLAGPGLSHDTLRVHSLTTIINNLKIDPEYYTKSRLQLPVYVHTDLYLALGLDPTEIQKVESEDLKTAQSCPQIKPNQTTQTKHPTQSTCTSRTFPGSTQCTHEEDPETTSLSVTPAPQV